VVLSCPAFPPATCPLWQVSASFKVWPARSCANWKRDSFCMKPFVRWCCIWQTVNIAAIWHIHNVRLRKKKCWGELAKQCFHCKWSGIQAWMDSSEFVSSAMPLENLSRCSNILFWKFALPHHQAPTWPFEFKICFHFVNETLKQDRLFFVFFACLLVFFKFVFFRIRLAVFFSHCSDQGICFQANLAIVLVCVEDLKTLLSAPIISKLNQNVFHHRDKNNWSLSDHEDACTNSDKMKNLLHCGWLNLANVWNDSHVWCIAQGQNLMQNAFIRSAKQLRPTAIGWHHFLFLSILFWLDQWSLSSLLFLHGCENEAALVHVDITSQCGVNTLAACSCSLDICNPVCRRAEQRLLPDGQDSLH